MRQIGIREIAAEAGVSYMVASLALSDRTHAKIRYSRATRDRIHAVAERLHYRRNRTARNFVRRRHGTLAVLAESVYYFSRVTFNAMSLTALEHDLVLFFDRIPSGPGARPKCLAEDMADGVVAIGPMPAPTERLLGELAIPAVQVNTNVADGPGVVAYDEPGGVRLLIDAFARRGRRRIAWFDGPAAPRDATAHYSHGCRRTALAEICGAHGLPSPLRFTLDNDSIRAGMVEDCLRRHPRIDAIVVPQDRYLPKFYQACQTLGRRIGDDISILCYQPEWGAEMAAPRCGGIAVGDFDVGRIAIETIARVLQGEAVPTQILPYSLRPGESL